MQTMTTTVEDELAELRMFCGAVTEFRERDKRYLLLVLLGSPWVTGIRVIGEAACAGPARGREACSAAG